MICDDHQEASTRPGREAGEGLPNGDHSGVKRQLSFPDDVEVVDAAEVSDQDTVSQDRTRTLMMMHWVKSALTVNPCMVGPSIYFI